MFPNVFKYVYMYKQVLFYTQQLKATFSIFAMIVLKDSFVLIIKETIKKSRKKY